MKPLAGTNARKLAGAALRKIVVKYRDTALSNPDKCQALLRDLCPSCRKEIHALVEAQRAGVPSLLGEPGSGTQLQHKVARARLLMADASPLKEEFINWAILAWAAALGWAIALAFPPESPPVPPPVFPTPPPPPVSPKATRNPRPPRARRRLSPSRCHRLLLRLIFQALAYM